MENIFWLDKNVHYGLHRIYIDPLVDYLDGLVGEKRPIFFEMPVPEDTKIPLYQQTRRGTVVPVFPQPMKQKMIAKDQKNR